jgi:uncharacterized protein HemX
MANCGKHKILKNDFNKINTPKIHAAYSTTPVAASSGAWKIIVGIIIVAVLGGGAYLASQTISKQKNHQHNNLPNNQILKTQQTKSRNSFRR